MKNVKKLMLALLTLSTSLIMACAEEPVSGNVSLQTNPLAGASAAKLDFRKPIDVSPFHLFQLMWAGVEAKAAVSSFTTFNVCVSEISFEGLDGSAGLPDEPLAPGLLSFSPTDTNPLTIGSTTITPGTVIKKFKFVVRTSPTVCSGADYAVLFNDGTNGDISVTQDVSFEFDFESAGGHEITDTDSITLLLGDIVNAMVALGSGLNDSTIQTINVGQAQ